MQISDYGYLLINGQKVASASGEKHPIVNPFSQEVITHTYEADNADIGLAVESASEAFLSWRDLPAIERSTLLLKLASLIREGAEKLANLESVNTGKPIRDAFRETLLAADYFDYYGTLADDLSSRIRNASDQSLILTGRDPFGVCGLILPWNYPLLMAAAKSAPALAMGNTLIIKPAHRTPLTTLELGNLAIQAGFSPGVMNIITGRGGTTGDGIVRHPAIRRISFGGATTTGKEIMRTCADELKRVSLDLGGKSAAIVLGDAPLEKACVAISKNILENSGQNYFAKSRILIDQKVYDQAIDLLMHQFLSAKQGNPLSGTTTMGPLISFRQQERVLKYIELGLSAGANLHCGGRVPIETGLSQAPFIQPTLFTDVQPNMYIAREEIFGPVLCAVKTTDPESAVKIANNSIYGQNTSIWSKDLSFATSLADQLEVGAITINCEFELSPEFQLGKRKHSGIGEETGLGALREFSQAKLIVLNH